MHLRSAQLSPALCPCEPRRAPGVTQAVAYGARVDTLLLSRSSFEHRSLQVRSVRKYNTPLDVQLKPKRSCVPLGHMKLPRKHNNQLRVVPKCIRRSSAVLL